MVGGCVRVDILIAPSASTVQTLELGVILESVGVALELGLDVLAEHHHVLAGDIVDAEGVCDLDEIGFAL